MRKALIVGIDAYNSVNPLRVAVSDAIRMSTVLEKNGDGSPNFSVECHVCPPLDVTRSYLMSFIESLFLNGQPDVALFYFSGHGCTTSRGECIVTKEACKYNEGISMNDILLISNKSKARDKIIIFDCCHAGGMGDIPDTNNSYLAEGTTILAACQEQESAIELPSGGLYTSLVIDALQGGAADLRGEISPGSLYAYVDRSLGAWQQRPVFKTNVSHFTSLRRVSPPIDIDLLRKIPEFFNSPEDEFQLSPEFEYTDVNHVPEKVAKFKILQRYERVGLVVPVGEEHMYFAAMNNKSCQLTAVGMHYWNLAKHNMI